MNWSKQGLAAVVAGSLALGAAQPGNAVGVDYPTQASAAPASQPSPAVLDQLVAPIALYPDGLVAQILAAATWPAQVVEADRWMKQNSSLKGAEFAQAVNRRNWDPSVQGLMQFPLVLANMDRNLSWTSALGQAYANDPGMVLDAIQVMRWRARVAGHLNGNADEIVTIEGNDISIQPADAETVYLPEYDPWLVYGSPVTTWPDWDALPGLYVSEPDVWFGPAILVGDFAAFGWGWHHWGTDWHHHHVVFNQNPYRSHAERSAVLFGVHEPRLTRGAGFEGLPRVHEPRMAFAPPIGASGSMWHGAFGVGDHGLIGIHRGAPVGGFGASRGLGFAGGFHPGGFNGGGMHIGGIHIGGFHGGGFGGGFHGGGFGGGHR